MGYLPVYANLHQLETVLLRLKVPFAFALHNHSLVNKMCITMKRFFILSIVLISSLIATTTALGQQLQKYNLVKLLNDQKLSPYNRTVFAIADAGKPGIRLSEAPEDGVVWLTGIDFTSGTIEVDIRGKDLLQKSFLGIAFHGQDNNTYEGIYFRPFNFLATDAARSSHSVQYISHPAHPWHALRERFPGKYENPLNPAPQPNDWFHVQLDVTDKEISVYVNKAIRPSLRVQKVSAHSSGKIGFWVGNGSGGDFANLVIQKLK